MATTIKLTPRQMALARGDDAEYQSLAAAEAAGSKAEPAGDIEPEVGAEESDELDDGEELSEGGDEGSEEGNPSWLKDGDLDYAQSYGLSADDLGQFGSRAELQRFGRLTDQRALQQRRYAAKQSESDQAKKTDEKPETKVADKPADDAGIDKDFALVDPEKYVAANYDEETINLAKSLRQTQEILKTVLPIAQSVTKAQESDLVNKERAKFAEFDKTMDALNDPLFGVSKEGGDLAQAQTDNRKAVWQAMQEIQENVNQAAIAMGKTPPQLPIGVLSERARSALFADNQSHNKDAIKEQSKRRRPASGGNRGSQMPSGDADPDSPKAIANSPQIKEFWQRTQRANGMG